MRLANRLLGQPDDARLLIINADDFGLCHAANDGTAAALDAGLARSTTVMTPCPWARHGLRLLAERPGQAFGVHLTLVSEGPHYRWGPVAGRAAVPSLVDYDGSFPDQTSIADLLRAGQPAEIEAEFRAQIEFVLASGLAPTHLDWHCLYNGGRPEVFDLTFKLARAYGLALRVMGGPPVEALQERGFPTVDHGTLDSFRLPLDGKPARYRELLRDLPEGLSEWAVHPARDCAELRAVQPDGADVRQTDLDFLLSEEAQAVVRAEGIQLLDYRALQQVWRAHP